MDIPATRHSMLAAVRSGDREIARGGFETLVVVYWKPVYKYLRIKWSASGEDARDITQDFFARAFEKRYFDTYDPAKGRFRTFLRVCLDRFVAKERKAAGRLRRGGAHVVVPLDFETAEGELRQHDVAEPGADLDEYFHREWIRSLLALTVDDLRAELAAQGKALQFQVFQRYDLDDPSSHAQTTYASVARELGIAPTAVTNYLFAARRAFRRLMLERLRTICGEGDEFEAEARQLLRGGLR